MKKLTFAVALLALVALGSAAFAVVGTIDKVPGATLLLPYFEVNLDNPNGITTLFSINNASASAAVAHVTFWTDETVPTLDFDIYLTGYDVQTINIRDIFNGVLPVTADAASDPGDTISPKGSLSQDINFPGASGPCAAPSYPAGLNATVLAHIRGAHTGKTSPVFGRCSGFNYGDNIARGYITVDSVVSCNLQFPSDAGYFTANADSRNILWGDYFIVDPTNNFAQGETLVHLETVNATVPSFYERYNTVAGEDSRESLPNTFAVRYLLGGVFTGGTDLLVWRDSEIVSNLTGFTCGSNASWFPLGQTDAVSFDEQEHPTNLCLTTSDVSPNTGGAKACFPLEAQRVNVATGSVAAAPLAPPAPFGWLFLNLDTTTAGGLVYPGQAWVTAIMSASGRFSVGFEAITLDRTGTVILMP